MRLGPLYARDANVALTLLVSLLENKENNQRGIEITCWKGSNDELIQSWIDVRILVEAHKSVRREAPFVSCALIRIRLDQPSRLRASTSEFARGVWDVHAPRAKVPIEPRLRDR